MSNSQGKRRVTVTLDATLLDAVDRLSDNRSAAIEDALRLWHARQIEDRLLQFYQQRSTRDRREEQRWTQATQDAAMQAWNAEDPQPTPTSR